MPHPKPSKSCPFCKAEVSRPSRPRNQDRWDTYMTPVTYACGTSASENWSPPVQSKQCQFNISGDNKVRPRWLVQVTAADGTTREEQVWAPDIKLAVEAAKPVAEAAGEQITDKFRCYDLTCTKPYAIYQPEKTPGSRK